MENRSTKQELLKLLKEDEEFRYAIAGLLGFGEVLKRLDRHEEELKKLREDFLMFVKEQEKRWEENNRRWEEAYKRFEAIENELRALREDFNRFVELEERRWEETYKRFEAIEKTLQFHGEKIAELAKIVGELKVALGSIGRRLGRDLEKTILSLYKDAIERFGIDVEKIEKISFRDYDGKYLQKGAKLEIDIYISDKATYFIEVKSFADEDDVEWFNTKCSIFAKEKNIENYKKLLIAVNMLREALERAKELGIEVVYGSIIE
ncbi:MAG: DUF3782 domain-containing protein [Ignisphaera sp.]